MLIAVCLSQADFPQFLYEAVWRSTAQCDRRPWQKEECMEHTSTTWVPCKCTSLVGLSYGNKSGLRYIPASVECAWKENMGAAVWSWTVVILTRWWHPWDLAWSWMSGKLISPGGTTVCHTEIGSWFSGPFSKTCRKRGKKHLSALPLWKHPSVLSARGSP